MSQSAAFQASLIMPCKEDTCQMREEREKVKMDAAGHKRMLRQRQQLEPLKVVGRSLNKIPQQQPSGAAKANKWRREAGQNKGGKRLQLQGHASRDEAPALAPGMEGERPSRRFPAPDPHMASPLPLLCAGMAPSWPYLVQKQQPRFPPIRSTSRVVSETLAAASVPNRPGHHQDARTEMEENLWKLVTSAGSPRIPGGTGAEKKASASEDLAYAPLWLLPKPPHK